MTSVTARTATFPRPKNFTRAHEFEYESLGKQQIFELFIRIVPCAPGIDKPGSKIYSLNISG